MIHLLRSNGTYRFRNKTPEKITEMVCKDIGINVRNLAKTGLVLNKMFFQERPYYEIIMAAYTKVHRKNKKPYIAQMNGDTLEVIEKGKTIPGFHIKQGERILESSYSENTDDMVTGYMYIIPQIRRSGSLPTHAGRTCMEYSRARSLWIPVMASRKQ